ncbi:peptide chain release factor 1 [uncultured Bacteroides sp.]|uniref:peptide chain release factor 1 n=1 Tax=uncultured Bacteroides sp. TaxID=162156 RepID=UPI002AAB52EE|nr:peptide chain release factor 1 [uncultured Bacteroides sp.]
MEHITIEQLIEEGKVIKKGISYINPPSGVIRTYSAYRISGVNKYEVWKNKTIRFLSVRFPDDRCIADFENAASELVKSHCSPSIFDKMLGILESCEAIPAILKSHNDYSNIDKSIKINVSQNQHQSQEQILAIAVFIESIKDELTGKQQKELKGIINEEPDPVKAKTKVLDKIKSFGLDVTSNIIANIVTNPAIWGNF